MQEATSNKQQQNRIKKQITEESLMESLANREMSKMTDFQLARPQ